MFEIDDKAKVVGVDVIDIELIVFDAVIVLD